jgi:hypothetical protein
MFEINREEYEILRCQFGTLRWGEHAKYLPFAFTEQGVERRVDDHDQALEIAFNTLKKFMVPKELLPKEYSPEEKKMGFGKDKRNHG